MNLDLKLKKSNGVAVTNAVKQRLVGADRARDAKDWSTAAAGYRQALERAPELTHIWIQLGHVLKETQVFDEAAAAYLRASELAPASAEPHLHLGHLRKRQGDVAGANRSYLHAARLQPSDPDVMAELYTVATRSADLRPDDLLEVLRPLLNGDVEAPADPVAAATRTIQSGVQDLITALGRRGAGPDGAAIDQLASLAARVADTHSKSIDPIAAGPALVFDVSDLISYFRRARLPTGIQRVQIEIISNALTSLTNRLVKICCFVEHSDDWLEIPASQFLALCRLSLSGGDRTAPEWTIALARLYILFGAAAEMRFPRGAFLINLGTSWWLQNYFMMVRKAKAAYGIRYVPFVHDMIPVMVPEYCTKELTQDFISWAVGAFDHADFFLVNSRATQRDLTEVADRLGHASPEQKSAVVPLNADFHKSSEGMRSKTILAVLGLHDTPFVLFVSTVEARKNHLCAFEAWIDLVRRHGARKTPKLVCVGNKGWLNDAVYARLDASDILKSQVVMVSGLSDGELSQLYRNCLFSLYPSRYEGWGLPVTESLCYGKVPLISETSSLPEAGGPFAVYFESGSARSLGRALERLIFERPYREACERKIKQEFSPRSWRSVAEQVADQVSSWAAIEGIAAAEAPQVELGAYHPLERNFQTRIWSGMRSAEIFRFGDGWWGPDDWGCWTKAQGGRLAIGLPDRHGALRAFLKLQGLPTLTTGYEVKAGGRTVQGQLRPGEVKWIPVDLPPTEAQAPVLDVHIAGNRIEDLGEKTQSQDLRHVAVGLAGFYICQADDVVARTTFLEAVALGNLADLAFNRERETAISTPGISDLAHDRSPSRAFSS